MNSKSSFLLIKGIPATTPLSDLALLPHEDLEAREIVLYRYQQEPNGPFFYGMFIALKIAGTIARAQEWLEDIPGASIEVLPSGYIHSVELGEHVQLPRDSNGDCFRYDGFSPLHLAISTFLGPDGQSHSRPTATLQATPADTTPKRWLSESHKKAQALFHEAARLKGLAHTEVEHLNGIKSTCSSRFNRTGAGPQSGYDDEEIRLIKQVQSLAFKEILNADKAKEAAEVALEIAHFYDLQNQGQPSEPILEHALIYCESSTSKIPYPPSELAVPPIYLSRPTLGWRMWKFPLEWGTDELNRLQEKIERTLVEHGFRKEDCQLDRPSQNTVTIRFIRIEDYLRAKDLRLVWNTHLLELIDSKGPLPENTTVLKLENVLVGQDEQAVLKECLEALNDYLVFEMVWRIDQVRLINGVEVTETGTSLIALVAYKQCDREPGRKWACEEVPGFVKLSSGIFPVMLLGRVPFRCLICMGATTLQYHESKQCSWYCRYCHDGRNHVNEECPKRRSADETPAAPSN